MLAFGLKSMLVTATPQLDQIAITYCLTGFKKCTDSEIEILCIDGNTTRVTNISAGTLMYLRANLDF